MPRAEVILWSHLRRRQVLGKKFRRQVSIDNYFVDFFCFELLLVIEVDGPTHFTREAAMRDAKRQNQIEREGIRFLRFTNWDVYDNIEGVMEIVFETVAELSYTAMQSANRGNQLTAETQPLDPQIPGISQPRKA